MLETGSLDTTSVKLGAEHWKCDSNCGLAQAFDNKTQGVQVCSPHKGPASG